MKIGELSQVPEDAREDGEEESDGTLDDDDVEFMEEVEDLRGVVVRTPRLLWPLPGEGV